jgi:hypothetical protein
MSYAHGQNKGKWSRSDDRDVEQQPAFRIHWNNREHRKSKLGFPNPRAIIRKLSGIWALIFFNIANPVLVEFKEYLL